MSFLLIVWLAGIVTPFHVPSAGVIVSASCVVVPVGGCFFDRAGVRDIGFLPAGCPRRFEPVAYAPGCCFLRRRIT
ncbi:MAG: hypothetical protein FWH27_10625 [Planctomycetaceae bacterium]|nr:hypothetical protein [Planctomycetaceae bacterium]